MNVFMLVADILLFSICIILLGIALMIRGIYAYLLSKFYSEQEEVAGIEYMDNYQDRAKEEDYLMNFELLKKMKEEYEQSLKERNWTSSVGQQDYSIGIDDSGVEIISTDDEIEQTKKARGY